MPATPVYVFSDRIIFQTLGTEAVLLNLDDDSYYGLNEVGTRLWQLLQEHGDLEPVVAQLLSEYEVDEATLRQDIAKLIDEWIEHKMLNIQSQ